MSIRMIAKELYALHQDVERLTRNLDDTPFEKQAAVREKLRRAVAARERMRRILKGRLGGSR